MSASFLTSLSEQEFKEFLKSAITEIIGEDLRKLKSTLPDILNIKEASIFLKLKITTLYEKTSRKIIPHFKKGNKLYFNRDELQAWVKEGKVKTTDELQSEASSYTMHKDHQKRQSSFNLKGSINRL